MKKLLDLLTEEMQSAFEAAGYEVVPVVRGLGEFEGIRQLLVQHAQEAVDSLK